MFSLLNKRIDKGRDPAKMCKIIDSLSVFSDSIRQRVARPFYLLEGEGFRGKIFPGVGHRIAFPVRQPVWVRIRDERG
ncbi:MAG: hypothetical protein DMG35_04220 [Acidobacteria bacterium]|nr:MAG: hypothetical protein DMG35_04220 [Acidobacteriota bacterium]